MKKIFCLIAYILMLIAPLSFAKSNIGEELNTKLDQATNYLKKPKDSLKAWQTLEEITILIKQHPEYDDGEYAEGIIDFISNILTKPWVYTKPYLIGEKSSSAFQNFIVDHVNELSPTINLKIIKNIITKNCDQLKYPVCKRLVIKIEQNL